ncbi:MAG: beta-Ala-His dipeptidase [Selenomonadaceae bacterium]|nr:beta-Ala-His dipeptidase [Selenomonadaceae bacterium]
MSEILENVLDEFKKLAAIPRQSEHEEKISDFLKNYLSDMNFSVIQDASKNIIADIPASPGKENSPQTILQAHIDMVCVAENGYKYDPLTDPIKLVRTEEFLQAEGTSLGADNGVGVAEILYIAKNHEKFSHGPIKIIFTTCEERGMDGVKNISAEHFKDAKFLINTDSENYDEIVVGSAGSVHVNFNKKMEMVPPADELTNSFKIKIFGLRGGHSGIDIADHRANAIKVLRIFLRLVKGKGNFQPASFSGGSASNVISSSAEAVIVTDLDMGTLNKCAELIKIQIKTNYGSSEPNLKVEIYPVEKPEKVMSTKDFGEFMNLTTIIHSGVYEKSVTNPDAVETSANIGIVRTEDDFLKIQLLARSHVPEMLSEFVEMYTQAAFMTNFGIRFKEPSPVWNYNPDSKLVKIMEKIFEEQNNFPPKVKIIHAGLECSYFPLKNKNLDIVSIGTTNENIHSTKERLHLKTVEPQVKLIISTLEKISELENA